MSEDSADGTLPARPPGAPGGRSNGLAGPGGPGPAVPPGASPEATAREQYSSRIPRVPRKGAPFLKHGFDHDSKRRRRPALGGAIIWSAERPLIGGGPGFDAFLQTTVPDGVGAQSTPGRKGSDPVARGVGRWCARSTPPDGGFPTRGAGCRRGRPRSGRFGYPQRGSGFAIHSAEYPD